MTPDFALSLSFEGIRLLHRGPQGWRPVGEVPLDSPDLAGDLAALRRAGEAVGEPWRGTKILLPDEQVRTLVLEGPDAGLEAARRALDGATPYAVDDLVIDHISEGGRTHVAAVARETLDEAEAFAAGHGFRPVSFAALPASGYPAEAFFGPTSMAGAYLGDEPVGREGGDLAADDSWSELAASPVDAEPEPVEAADATVDPDAADEPLVGPIRDEPLPDATPDEPDDAPPLEVEQIEPVEPDAAALPDLAEPEPVPAAFADPESPEDQDVGAAEADPADAPDAGSPAPDATTPEPEVAADPAPEPAPEAPPPPSPLPRAGTPLSATGVPQPVFASRTRSLGGHTREAAAPPAPRQSRDRARHVPALGPGAADATLGAIGLAAPTDVPRRATPKQAMPPKRREPAFGRQPTAAPDPATAAPARESKAARPARPPREPRVSLRAVSRPRHLGLVLTVVLLVLMAAVAVWAAVSEQGLAGLFGRGEAPEVEVAAPPEADPVAPVPDTVPEEVAAVPAPDVEAAAAAVARAIEALPPPESAPAPDAWPEGPGPLAGPGGSEEAVPPPAVADVPSSRPEAPSALAALAPDAAPVAPPAPDSPPPAPVRLVEGEPPVVPPPRSDEAAGNWVNAMAEPPAAAPRLRPEGLAPPEAVATAAGLGSGDPPRADAAPADADALIAALVPGAEPLPSGPALPSALAFAPVPPDAPTPGGVSLAGLRPSARPGTDETEAPVELTAFDGPRPGPRPDGLAPDEAPTVDVSDAVAEALESSEAPEGPNLETTLAAIVANAPDPLAGATARAVPIARRPDPRPSNFGRVVATQLDRLARASQPRAAAAAPSGNLAPNEAAESEPEAASSAAAAPSGTTAASVAAAATIGDAISMREMNLIGVYGQPGARRALIRMSNGRYVRVSVGDNLDGGQVTAIGDNALNYVKRGRTEVLVIPGG